MSPWRVGYCIRKWKGLWHGGYLFLKIYQIACFPWVSEVHCSSVWPRCQSVFFIAVFAQIWDWRVPSPGPWRDQLQGPPHHPQGWQDGWSGKSALFLTMNIWFHGLFAVDFLLWSGRGASAGTWRESLSLPGRVHSGKTYCVGSTPEQYCFLTIHTIFHDISIWCNISR